MGKKRRKRTYDIDIALEPYGDIPLDKWVELRERIEESPIPYNVDLVDLSKANRSLVQKVALKMTDDRNLTIHTYNEELSIQIFERIPDYYILLRDWMDRLNKDQ